MRQQPLLDWWESNPLHTHFYRYVAHEAFPRGGTMTCRRCQRQVSFTMEDAARYLKDGWKQCCDTAMFVKGE